MKHLLLATAILTLATPASAQIAEVRLGANIQDINWTSARTGNPKERSIAINGEIIFEEPEFLKWAFSPQPYIGGTVKFKRRDELWRRRPPVAADPWQKPICRRVLWSGRP